jgi:hypothetical protein
MTSGTAPRAPARAWRATREQRIMADMAPGGGSARGVCRLRREMAVPRPGGR